MHHHQRYPVRAIVVSVCIVLLYLLYTNATKAQSAIVIAPGQDIVAIINAAPQNAVIDVQAGTYFVGSAINPKAGQTINGTGLVTLTGARDLTSWTASNGLWYVGGQTQQGKRTASSDWSVCSTAYPRCNYPEDVFINREPLRHMQALNLVKPGCKCYFFDYDADRIYIADNPAGRRVQTSVTPQAITSGAANVTIRNITVEMFSSPTQDAALQANGNGWHLDKVTAQLNHGAGVLLRGSSSMRNSDVSHNGGIGAKVVGLNNGQAVDTVIDNTVCNFNNYAGVDQYFEAGCAKLVRTTRAQVTNCTVIGNHAKGVWFDIDNSESYVSGCDFDGNESNALYFEIGGSAVATGNRFVNNGIGGDGGYFSAINITNASGVTVSDNYIVVGPAGNGISVRGDGSRPTYSTNGNSAINNTIVSETGRGRLMNIEAVNGGRFPTNTTIAGNTYYVQNATYKHWRNASGVVDFVAWSQPLNGEVLTVGLPMPEPTATPSPEPSTTPVIPTMTPTWEQPSATPEMTPTAAYHWYIEIDVKIWQR